MKILHVCLGNYYADNFGYQENLLTKYHKRDGFDVVILASRRNYSSGDASMFLDVPGEYINEDDIKVKRIDFKFTKGLLLASICQILKIYDGVYKHIENESPDIIFLHNAQFADVGKVIAYKKRNPNVKIYVDNHADFVNSARTFLSRNVLHRLFWRYHIRRLEPHCERFWGVTPNRCDFLRQVYGISNAKIELLPLGAASEKIDMKNRDKIRKDIRQALGIQEDDFVLISGGRIDRRKNIHNLISAVTELANPKIKLLLFGVPTKDMQATIKSLSDSQYIRNVGWIDSNSVYDFFIAADLGVFPGTHSVLWEQAVGSGLPCVFREWRGMTHLDVGGNCSFIHDGDTKTIKNVISLIHQSKRRYEEMRLASVSKGMPFFSYEEISRKAIGL